MPDNTQNQANTIPGLDNFAAKATANFGLTDMRISRSEGNDRDLDIDAVFPDPEDPDGIVVRLYGTFTDRMVSIGDLESPIGAAGYDGAVREKLLDYKALNLTRRRSNPTQKSRYGSLNVLHSYYVQAVRIERGYVTQESLRLLEVIDAAAREHTPGPKSWQPPSGQTLAVSKASTGELPDLAAFNKTVADSGLANVRVRVSPEWGPLDFDIAATIPGTADAPYGIPIALQWTKPWTWGTDATHAGHFLRVGDATAPCSSEYDIDLEALGLGHLDLVLSNTVTRAARALWAIHQAIKDVHLKVVLKASDYALERLDEVAEARTRPVAKTSAGELD